MFQIKFDLSGFTPVMARNEKKIPEAIKRIIEDISHTVSIRSKEELYPGHGKVSGDLRRSIRPDFSQLDQKIATVGPHKDYADVIESGNPLTKFKGYHYMNIGAGKAAREALGIAGRVMKDLFG